MLVRHTLREVESCVKRFMTSRKNRLEDVRFIFPGHVCCVCRSCESGYCGDAGVDVSGGGARLVKEEPTRWASGCWSRLRS